MDRVLIAIATWVYARRRQLLDEEKGDFIDIIPVTNQDAKRHESESQRNTELLEVLIAETKE